MKTQTLNVEQVAAICGVSVGRVKRWIETRVLEANCLSEGNGNIEKETLIQFLIKHNIPIPDSVLPFKSKKALFFLTKDMLDDIFLNFLIRFFNKLKRESNFIIDYVAYGTNAKMKLMVFRPDIVLLDETDNIMEHLGVAHMIKKAEELNFIKVVKITKCDEIELTSINMSSSPFDAIVSRKDDIRSLIYKMNSVLMQSS